MRKSTKVKNVPTLQEAQEAFKEMAEAQAELSVVVAKMEQRIQKIRAANEQKIKQLTALSDEKFKVVELWALENKEAEFSSKKSQDWGLGKIGFRTGTPKVAYLKGMSRKALGNVEEANLTTFLRTKKELDKDMILNSREDAELMEALKKCGIYVKQDETFFVDLKEEEIE